MSKLIDELIGDVLKKEGGYVNHPADKRGATKYGITIKTLEAWRGKDLTPHDVERMSSQEARDIYHRLYYLNPNINTLPEALQPIVFDMAVNHGCNRAVKIAQKVFNKMGKPIKIDGSIGAGTVASAKAALNVYGKEVVINIVYARIQFYKDLVFTNPSQSVFLAGWINRAESFLT